MNEHRGWIRLVMGFAALFSCACMLFSQGAGQTGNNEEDIAGFEETLAAELEGAFEDDENLEVEPETLPDDAPEEEDRQPVPPAPGRLAGLGAGALRRLARGIP